MPQSKRSKVVHLTRVAKKTREHKDKLFGRIRTAVGQYKYIFVVGLENLRNTHLRELRQQFADSQLFLGKTKLTARALGTTVEEEQADGLHELTRYVTGTVGLLFTNRLEPEAVVAGLAALRGADFAQAGATAPRDIEVPTGIVYSTGGQVPAADDVPAAAVLEPEFRRLGMPTRLHMGTVLLGNEDGSGAVPYVICREGQELDARQTRLLRLFSICLAEFTASVRAYWSADTGQVTEVEGPATGHVDAGTDDAMEA